MAACGQIISSEESYDFNCTPCSQQDRLIEAKRFCVECGEYFCSTCLSWHERFGVTKGHTLVKCENVSKDHVPLTLSKCETHTGKEEDMVCGDHYVVCCRVCITKDHRSCQNVDFLPDLIQKFKEDETLVELNEDLNGRKEKIKSVLKEYTAHALKLKTRRTTCMKRLEMFEKSIIECVKSVVAKAETDIESRLAPEICSTQEYIQRYNELLSRLDCMSASLANENNGVAEYKNVLEGKRILNEIQIDPCMFDDKLTTDCKFQNEIMEAITSSLKEGQLYGTVAISEISDSGNDFVVPNMYVQDYDSSALILLTDYYNINIRRIDNCLKEKERLTVEGRAWGFCKIDEHDIAFTLPVLKKVQFISADTCHAFKTSFNTDIHCRGIACLNEKIYVTGGGMNGEEQGQLNMFDLKGKLLSKYDQDLDGNYFSIPRSIIVNTEGIFITDEQNGVICLDLEGQRKWVTNNSKCKFPWGICFTPKGNLFVSGHLSNNIVILSKDGEFLGELLNENDGLSAPGALSIDKPNNCIIVSEFKKPHLKMFYIGDCDM
ncbi:uncharacterized protein LOC132723589 [Ruditapes philippinarum]|uniref:uncharacterized protein LOC132723589 n=1 Tax=Ruditapes philippinarum TaxID=129788 RepID=UPI00295B6AA7|nr:uncharacterized protein LOC132723589 [Ruditapes philippinarum]